MEINKLQDIITAAPWEVSTLGSYPKQTSCFQTPLSSSWAIFVDNCQEEVHRTYRVRADKPASRWKSWGDLSQVWVVPMEQRFGMRKRRQVVERGSQMPMFSLVVLEQRARMIEAGSVLERKMKSSGHLLGQRHCFQTQIQLRFGST
jgi:hypothetical protein